MPSNPFYAFVELWIGDVNMTLIPPQHLQSFTYTRTSANELGKFIISLFDETAILVENQLIKGYDNIRFQYGYVDPNTSRITESSKIYSGIVTEYDTDFSPVGAVLTIEGWSTTISTFASPKSDTYTDMSIDAIVRQIAKEEGWIEGTIVPCEPVSDGDALHRPFTRNNQTPQEFIVNDLIPLAKSSATGDSNFTLSFEEVDDEIKVNFCPITQAAILNENNVHNYQFQWGSGDKESKVISFNPDYSGTLCLMMGGGVVDSSTLDRLTNDIVNMKFTSTDDPNRVVLADRSAYDYKAATRYLGGSAQSPDEMKRIAAYMWYNAASEPINADLTILGDTQIQPFDLISIVMLNKDGLPHHSSGIYLIREVEDDIVGGSFTTKLTLMKNAMSIGLNESGGIDVNANVDYSINSTTDDYWGDDYLASGSATADSLVSYAVGEEGYKEGSNGYTKYGDWYADGFENEDWCAMFVAYCADHAGVPQDVIPRYASCTSYRDWFKNKGQWHSRSSGYSPKKGDLIIFDWSTDKGGRDGNPDHIGIVVSNDGSRVHTIEGNTSNQVKQKDYSLTSLDILGYCSPAYPDAGNVLGSTRDYSSTSDNETTALNFILQVMGFNLATACGILANMEAESSFSTGALGDDGTSYGLCQWHLGRWDKLKTYCSNNGLDPSSANGQLRYMYHELQTDESTALSMLQNLPNTADGAYRAGYNWCYYYERPDAKESTSRYRGNKAKNEYWDKYQGYSPAAAPAASGNYVWVGNSLAYGLATADSKPTLYTKVGGTVDSTEVKNIKGISAFSNIVIELGTNEIHNGMSCSDFISKLKSLISQYQNSNRNAKVYVVSIAPVSSDYSTRLTNDNIRDWNSQLSLACSKITNTTFVDCSLFFQGFNQWGGDKLHLTSAGYSSWKDSIKKAIGLS